MIIFICILIFIAAIANATMDLTENETLFHKSIFKGYQSKFIDAKNITYVNKYDELGRKKLFWIVNLPVAFTDIWHLSKSVFLNTLFLALSLLIFVKSNNFFTFLSFLLVSRFFFGFFFFIFYSYILRIQGFKIFINDLKNFTKKMKKLISYVFFPFVFEFLVALIPTTYFGNLANNAPTQTEAYNYTYTAIGVFIGTYIITYFLRKLFYEKT